jgi:hypothetical protein
LLWYKSKHTYPKKQVPGKIFFHKNKKPPKRGFSIKYFLVG